MAKHIHASRRADMENLKSIAWGLQDPCAPMHRPRALVISPSRSAQPMSREGWHGGARRCWTRTGGRDRLQGECKEQVRVRWGWAWASLQLSLSRGGWQLGSPTWGDGGWWGMPGARAAPWSMWEGWSAAPKGDAGIGRETRGWGSCMFLPCMRPERWQVFGKRAFSAVCNN